MKSFAESYLTGMLERRLLLEESQLYEVDRGLGQALKDRQDAPLKSLASAVERIVVVEEQTAIVNLLEMPLGPLWVGAALRQAREKLSAQKKSSIIIVGLWQVLRGVSGRRSEATERRFSQWRDFVEGRLAALGDVTILWIG